jgi:hypothetical protein
MNLPTLPTLPLARFDLDVLTNPQINLLIAQIEDVNITDSDEDGIYYDDVKSTNVKHIYEPIVDDAMCYRFMFKYNIKLTKQGDKYVAMYTHCRGEEGICPNRTLLMAIIALTHKL